MYVACNSGKICSLSLSIHLSLRITVFLARFLIRRFAATAASRDGLNSGAFTHKGVGLSASIISYWVTRELQRE